MIFLGIIRIPKENLWLHLENSIQRKIDTSNKRSKDEADKRKEFIDISV